MPTRTRYAIEATADLANERNGGPVVLREIAQRQEISINYLKQVLLQVRTAGRIRSERGARGGFELSRSTCEVKMSEIAEVLGGSTALSKCVSGLERCKRSRSCAVREIWVEVGESVKRALGCVTLRDAANLQRTMEASLIPVGNMEEGKRR